MVKQCNRQRWTQEQLSFPRRLHEILYHFFHNPSTTSPIFDVMALKAQTLNLRTAIRIIQFLYKSFAVNNTFTRAPYICIFYCHQQPIHHSPIGSIIRLSAINSSSKSRYVWSKTVIHLSIVPRYSVKSWSRSRTSKKTISMRYHKCLWTHRSTSPLSKT